MCGGATPRHNTEVAIGHSLHSSTQPLEAQKSTQSNMSQDQRNELVSFDEIDYANYADLRKAQESMVREQWIRIQALKVCRNALEKCYKNKGVNHREDCRDLAERYMQMMDSQGRVEGFYGYQKNDPTK